MVYRQGLWSQSRSASRRLGPSVLLKISFSRVSLFPSRYSEWPLAYGVRRESLLAPASRRNSPSRADPLIYLITDDLDSWRISSSQVHRPEYGRYPTQDAHVKLELALQDPHVHKPLVHVYPKRPCNFREWRRLLPVKTRNLRVMVSHQQIRILKRFLKEELPAFTRSGNGDFDVEVLADAWIRVPREVVVPARLSWYLVEIISKLDAPLLSLEISF